MIDTTSANDNVWKMLLGAVNENFDDDPDDEQDEDETPHKYNRSPKLLYNSSSIRITVHGI